MTTAIATNVDTKPAISKSDLEKLETVVKEGLKSFVATGRALVEIREKHGYALRGYKSFDEYCVQYLHISERHGFRLMDGYETATKVQKALGEAPRNEAAARVLKPIAGDDKLLSKLKTKLAEKKLDVATATAEKLQEVVDKITPHTKPMFDDKPKPPVAIAGLSDECPACHKTPTIYSRNGGGWTCGECHAMVRVGALPLEIALCISCHAPLLDDSSICRKCGTINA